MNKKDLLEQLAEFPDDAKILIWHDDMGLLDTDFVAQIDCDINGYFVEVTTFINNVGDVTLIAGKNKGWDINKANLVKQALQTAIYEKNN